MGINSSHDGVFNFLFSKNRLSNFGNKTIEGEIKVDALIQIIKRKGFIESVYQGLRSLTGYILSKLAIIWLNMRGYDIDFTVSLGRKTIFFQSHKKNIKISHHSKIGSGVKIASGFGGMIVIQENVAVFDYTIVDIHNRLTIGENTLIAPFCYITDYDHLVKDESKPIIKQGYISKPISIGKNVWLGTHTIILKGVTIGDNTIIGAGSVVTRDIPSGSVAAGNPARIIKKL